MKEDGVEGGVHIICELGKTHKMLFSKSVRMK